MNFSKNKVAVILLVLLNIFSCSKEEVNLSNLNETIYVRHKQADMPAHIHGNASEKVFLIVLHGGPGGAGLQYRVNDMITRVEKNNAIVYFDQRGSGNAQGSYSVEDISIDIMAEDVLALVKVMKEDYGDDAKFFLMGHSWGGTLGPATLLKDQEEFSGWINVDGAHTPRGTYDEYQTVLTEKANEQISLGNSIQYWEGVLELVQNLAPGYSHDNLSKLNLAAHDSESVLTEDLVINKPQFIDEDGTEQDLIIRNNSRIKTVLVENGLFRDESFTNDLPSITIPSLVLWGKHDLIVPIRFAQEAFDNLGSANKELFIFERSGHIPMDTEPALFADKVIDFINEHR